MLRSSLQSPVMVNQIQNAIIIKIKVDSFTSNLHYCFEPFVLLTHSNQMEIDGNDHLAYQLVA